MGGSDAPHELNGQAVKPKRKPRPKKPGKIPSEEVRVVHAEPKEESSGGRLGSDLRERGVDFLLRPFIPRGMLSMVVGLPAVGKSTFIAWLVAQAGCAAIMPGFEEEVEVTTLPRLQANGANLRLIRFLDDRDYRLPRDKQRIASILKHWEAEILVMDPIDSYMEEDLNENAGRDVRLMLEAAAWVAKESGAAVVGVRHPGKDRLNVMPGSRQWRAVPRSIVELCSDGNSPPRLLIRHYKDSLGQDARPRQYRLEGERGKPRRFVMSDEVDTSMGGLAQAAADPTERLDIQTAGRHIRHLFETTTEASVTDLVNLCRSNGIGDKARREAVRLLGIFSKPSSSGGKWIMYRTGKDWPSWTDVPKS